MSHIRDYNELFQSRLVSGEKLYGTSSGGALHVTKEHNRLTLESGSYFYANEIEEIALLLLKFAHDIKQETGEGN